MDLIDTNYIQQKIYIISAIRYNDRENRNCTMVFG